MSQASLLRVCMGCRSQPLRPRLARSAHAATASSPDEGPSRSSSSTGTNQQFTSNYPNSRDFKGKGRERDTDYRFPQRGSSGGPPDPYEVLGLDRSASHEEVKRQYYRLALILHPDSAHPSSCPENFSKMHKAYTLLAKPASRMRYLQTGQGWGDSSSSSSSSSVDDFMRAEIRYRARSGAAAWDARPEYGARYRQYGYGHGHGYGHGQGDRGRGAWGGFAGGDGKWEAYDTGEFSTHQGKGEERYMTNLQFFGLIGAIVSDAVDRYSTALSWVQYQRFLTAKGSHEQILEQQHLDASHALAEARREAAQHGKERREHIRRRVREAEVIRELERVQLAGGVNGGSGRA